MRDKNCKSCPLHEGVRNVCIPGDGPDDAEVLALGIAPGQQEDEQDRIFVGRSGELLRRCMKKSELEVALENVNRCRPPDNRDPTKEEIAACRPHLEAAARRFTRLRVVVPLGAIPLRACGLKGAVLDVAGKPVEGDFFGHKVTFVPVPHPSYVLRNPSYIDEWEAHWQIVKGLVSKRTPDELQKIVGGVVVEGRIWDAAAGLPQTSRLGFFLFHKSMPDGPPFSIDFETTHLRPEHASMLCYSISDGEVTAGKWIKTGQDMADLREILKAGRWTVHNSSFEGLVADELLDVPMNIQRDTLIMSIRVDPAVRASLDAVTARYAEEIAGFKHETQAKTAAGVPWWELDHDNLLRRNMADTWGTEKARRELESRLSTEACAHHSEDIAIRRFVGRVERRGLYIDQDRMIKLRKELDVRQHLAVERAREILGCDINLASYAQVGKAFVDRLGIALPMNPRTRNTLTDDVTLKKAVRGRENSDPAAVRLVEAVLAHRKAFRTASTNVKGYAMRRSPRDGRLRTKLIWPGAFSFRLASSSPNLQNVPRGEVRRVFTAPPGHVLVEGDYSQIELRVAAALSRDPMLMRVFIEKIDAHVMLARRVYAIPPLGHVDPDRRQHGKTANYSCLYGIGIEALQARLLKDTGIWLDEETIHRLIQGFWEQYRGLRLYMDEKINDVRRGRTIHAPIAGYAWGLRDAMLAHPQDQEHAIRSVVNATIQCVPPRLSCKAGINADTPGLLEIVLQTHDGLIGYAPEKLAKEAAEHLKVCMDAETREDWWGGVPCPATVKVGPSWDEAKEVK